MLRTMRRLVPTILPLALLASALSPRIVAAACTDPPGPEVEWRRCYQDQQELRGVDLSEARLRDASFVRATLDGSSLAGADAFRARFVSASLVNVRLDEARLYQADLTKADLTGSSLRSADLRGAKLVSANLTGADMTGARLDGADLRGALLAGARWSDGVRVCAERSVGQCEDPATGDGVEQN